MKELKNHLVMDRENISNHKPNLKMVGGAKITYDEFSKLTINTFLNNSNTIINNC